MPATEFAWAVCQRGAEPALKAEIARVHPGWRFAYSRPGLVTWKTGAPVAADVALGAVFARAWGASLGKAADDAVVLEAARARGGGQPVVLHAFDREPGEAPEAGVADASGPVHVAVSPAEAVRERLLAAGAGLLETRAPRAGELVLDVIVGPAADEPLWLGFHAHGPGRSPHPGGRPPLVLPAHAPSRAWLKLEEALAWSRLPLRAGQTAVEIGSAPGGASLALLERGLTVVGVDPGDMDAGVRAHPRFQHLQLPLGELRRESLPAHVDWLLMDVNLAPQVAVHGVRRIVSTLRSTLRGVIFTLKLNDWKMADEVPALLERVAGMGLVDVRATQLPSNRREICVVGIHRRKP